ncbi:MAG: hypothetical protein AB7K24_30970, partial [Gemmataceae bacterium]
MPRTLLVLAFAVSLLGIYSTVDADEKGAAKPASLPAYDPKLVQEMLSEARALGDARRGAVLFGLPTSACLSCHKVGTRGGTVGPDLSTIGVCLKPEEIVEALLWPNRNVKAEFKAVAITTVDGKSTRGILRAETGKGLTLVDVSGKLVEIARDDIEFRQEIG